MRLVVRRKKSAEQARSEVLRAPKPIVCQWRFDAILWVLDCCVGHAGHPGVKSTGLGRDVVAPKADGSIGARRDQRRAIWRKSERFDFMGVAGEHPRFM